MAMAAAASSSSSQTPLLSSSSYSYNQSSRTILFISLTIATCSAAAAAAVAVAFVFLTTSSNLSIPSLSNGAKPLANLSRPTVILISSDGFRFGYQHKTHLPNIQFLIANGTEAETGLIPSFPTLTFPNHYSIVTGLYPADHGIINNYFVDPDSGEWFGKRSHEPHWWLGEPIWETVANAGFQAAVYFWAGGEVKKGSWDCPPKFCPKFDSSVKFEERVDTVLSYFDSSENEIPVFIALYLEDPDTQGHSVGPDDPAITAAVAHVDRVIGRLIQGLEKRGVFEDVTLILVGDHGMVGNCDEKLIFLNDLSPWIEMSEEWIHSLSPLLALKPTGKIPASEVVKKMNRGLSSGKVANGKFLKMYLKKDLPERLHYTSSSRIPPVIGILDEGYKVEFKRRKSQECSGAHGYDNSFFSMRTIFVAHGPQFTKGRKVPSFENVEIYNVITSILGLKAAPNNGSASFPDSILLPFG